MDFTSIFSKHRYASVASQDPSVGSEEPKPSGRVSAAGGFQFGWWSCAFALSVMLNVVLSSLKGPWITTITETSASQYAELPLDTEFTFQYYNDYWGRNETLADQLWDEIDTSPLMVTLSREYIETHSLPPSIPFPWDETRSLYYLKSFHLLHCLKHVRKAFKDYERYNTTTITYEHIFHCLDAFRQHITCHADDTPMPGKYEDHSLGDGQILQCRSIERLKEWAYEGDRNACFKMVDEYKPVKHSLEKYAFCDPKSRYYEAMSEHFRRYGHQQMFDD